MVHESDLSCCTAEGRDGGLLIGTSTVKSMFPGAPNSFQLLKSPLESLALHCQ
ncbi:MAG: hypothetical protein ACTSQL_10600 [Promethearchaeota archaeon]